MACSLDRLFLRTSHSSIFRTQTKNGFFCAGSSERSVGMRISLQGEYRIYVLFRSMRCPRGYTLYHMYCTSTSYECSVELKSPYLSQSLQSSSKAKQRQQGLPADGCAACARACFLHYLSIRVIDIERPRLLSPLLFPSRY